MAIALIEIQEEDLTTLGIPFVLLGLYQDGSSKKLVAAYRILGDLRKQMAEQHRKIEELEESKKDD